ncbi:hypothetical protein ACFCXA_09195 [Streptomyces virginiae]
MTERFQAAAVEGAVAAVEGRAAVEGQGRTATPLSAAEVRGTGPHGK